MMSNLETAAGASPSDLQSLLIEDHLRLERLFEELLQAFQAGDRDGAAALWSTFDRGLEAHMEIEEELILPALFAENPAEVEALLQEHVQIRTTLIELGVGVDLHCTRADAVERLVRELKAHAKREDALLYRWARVNLGEHVQLSIRARLLGTLRKLMATA
jgi:hemerythrin-like domain-containing protein